MADPVARPVVGTQGPVYVSPAPAAPDPAPVVRDQGYFLVRVHSAQASFRGGFWDNVRNRARHVVVTSQVSLKRRQTEEAFQNIQVVRPIRPNEAVQLGLRPNLVDLVPAVVERVSVKLGLVIDWEDRLAPLASGINGSGFLSTLSLAEPTLAAARAVAGVSKAVLDAFLPGKTQTPILEFAGDFNVGSADLRPGYYVFLGTTDPDAPLPQAAKLEVRQASLLVNGQPATLWSYVVLEVLTSPERGTNPDADWAKMIREAEGQADAFSNGFDHSASKQAEAQQRCQELIVGAQALLRADPTYTNAERKSIVAAAFKNCRDAVTGAGTRRASTPAVAEPWIETTLKALAVEAADLDQVDAYRKRVVVASEVFKLRETKDNEALEVRAAADALDRVPVRGGSEAAPG